eukprot:9501667-Lingulodinium_polyedra.AAC.1
MTASRTGFPRPAASPPGGPLPTMHRRTLRSKARRLRSSRWLTTMGPAAWSSSSPCDASPSSL